MVLDLKRIPFAHALVSFQNHLSAISKNSWNGIGTFSQQETVYLLIENSEYIIPFFRDGMASHVLRFVAVMDTNYSVDMSRRFIVSFYLSDDTIAVFEPPQRNSGVLGGKYLERGRVKLPGQEIFKSELTKYYTASDFYVGAKLMFNDITFIIVGADEYGE